MANNDLDGGQTSGNNQDANPGSSNGDGVQQLSSVAQKLQQSLDTLTTKVGEIDARTRTLQGDKDKGVKRALDEVSGLKARIAEYEQLKERFGADGAVEQLELKQTLADIQTQLSKLTGSVSTQAAGSGVGGAVDAAKVIGEYGLDPKDPQVGLLLGNRYESVEQVELAIARHIKTQRTAPSPTDAQVPADTSGVPQPKDAGALKAEYIRQVTAARGNKSIIKGLQARYSSLGVDVGNIDFRV